MAPVRSPNLGASSYYLAGRMMVPTRASSWPRLPRSTGRLALTIDLSSQIPSNFVQLDGGVLHFTDACGQVADTGQRNDDIQIVITPGEGGVPVVRVSCYANV